LCSEKQSIPENSSISLTNLKLNFVDKNIPQLNETEKDKCEIEINCAEALRQMKNGKTPGIDGLPSFGQILNTWYLNQ
jgi:hypothetical protein